MRMPYLIAALALAAVAPAAYAQDDAVQGDSQKVVIDANRVESPAATASAHCLRWRARAELIGSNGNYITYRCVRIPG